MVCLSRYTMLAYAAIAASATIVHSSDTPDSATEYGPQTHREMLISGRYKTGEIISKDMIVGENSNNRYRVEWIMQPAVGNCIVSLFSLFNADLLFDGNVPDSQKPPWSEIAIETFGGSATTTHPEIKQFQTQYISARPGDSPTQRGTQHIGKHKKADATVSDIYDGSLHEFVVEYLPYQEGSHDGEIQYFLDGVLLREEIGGDVNLLVPPLDIYAGVWSTQGDNSWGCTPDESYFYDADTTDDDATDYDAVAPIDDDTVTTSGDALFINCGGPAIGQYVADTEYLTGGMTRSFDTSSCFDPLCSERYGADVEYTIPISISGEYSYVFRPICFDSVSLSHFRFHLQKFVFIINFITYLSPPNTCLPSKHIKCHCSIQ